MRSSFVAAVRATSLIAIVCLASCSQDAKPIPVAQPGAPVPAAAAAPNPAEAEEEPALPREKFEGGERAFASVKAALLANYYLEGVSEDDLYRAAVEGMLERFDPKMQKWNKLIPPGELAEMRNDLKGEVVGIGVQIRFEAESGYTDVIAVLPGSPSERAGVMAGDKIVTVNGKLYKGMTLRDVVYDIRGKVGETVNLTVLRRDKLITVPVKREVVPFDGVSAIAFDKIGYVRIKAFTQRTPGEVRTALDDLSKKGVRALVIDLRDNHGGSFDAAVSTAELLLPAGTGIVTLKKRGAAEETKRVLGVPVVSPVATAVLVNHETSSGGELVAAALQEGLKATLVGARTFGKWSVQTIDDLPNGYAIKYTVSLFKTPAGKSYDGVGIAPDVDVDMDAKAAEKALGVIEPEKRLAADVQLRTAVALLRPRL